MTLSRQAFRYASVGLGVNLTVYLLYLGMTHLGLGYKLSMTLLYAAAVVSSFVLNRNWSFEDNGLRGPSFVKYLVAYGIFYVVNLLGLVVGVDNAGLPHEAVQAVMIVVCALGLFFTQRFWVFANARVRTSEVS